jgi:uncharacterized protein (DUF697 family)
MTGREPSDVSANRLVAFLLETGLGGAGPLSSAENLANGYLIDEGFASDDERVASLVKWEMSKNFTTGFITGLGGVVTFPISIPAALGASWLIQARMAGAIARIYGHDLESARVRTMVLLSLAGDVAKQAMKDLGLKLDNKLTQRAVEQIPGRALVEINKRIGTRLLAKVSQRVVLRFPRAVPVVGGVVGGALDAAVCRMVGKTAKSLFRPPSGAVIDGEVVRRGERGDPTYRRTGRTVAGSRPGLSLSLPATSLLPES